MYIKILAGVFQIGSWAILILFFLFFSLSQQEIQRAEVELWGWAWSGEALGRSWMQGPRTDSASFGAQGQGHKVTGLNPFRVYSAVSCSHQQDWGCSGLLLHTGAPLRPNKGKSNRIAWPPRAHALIPIHNRFAESIDRLCKMYTADDSARTSKNVAHIDVIALQEQGSLLPHGDLLVSPFWRKQSEKEPILWRWLFLTRVNFPKAFDCYRSLECVSPAYGYFCCLKFPLRPLLDGARLTSWTLHQGALQRLPLEGKSASRCSHGPHQDWTQDLVTPGSTFKLQCVFSWD